jgi:hypothetical protein
MLKDFLSEANKEALGKFGETTPIQRAVRTMVEESEEDELEIAYTTDGFSMRFKKSGWDALLDDDTAAMAIGAKELRRR